MLRVSWTGSALDFPAILRAGLLRMMVKLTIHWIVFPFGLQQVVLSLFQHGRSDCHFIAVISQMTLFVFMSCSAGETLAVRFIKGGRA